MRQFRYSVFELLVLIFGVGTVLTMILTSTWQTTVEIIAHLLLIPILVSVLHYGRNGGLLTFSLASLAYLSMRVPDIMKMGLIDPIIQLLIVRILVYGVVGIGGGIICARIKYLFAKMDQPNLIDKVTGLFNPDYLGQLLKNYVEEFERYEHPFSVAILKIESTVFNSLKDTQLRRKLRILGLSICNDIRAVDEASRISQNEFAFIFPNTNASGATVAGERLQKLVENYLKKQKHSIEEKAKIRVEIFCYPEDREKIGQLLKRWGNQELPQSPKSHLTLHR